MSRGHPSSVRRRASASNQSETPSMRFREEKLLGFLRNSENLVFLTHEESSAAQQTTSRATRRLSHSAIWMRVCTLLGRCPLLIELPAHLEPPRVIRSRQIAKWPRPPSPTFARMACLQQGDLANTSCILFVGRSPPSRHHRLCHRASRTKHWSVGVSNVPFGARTSQ